jgi:hypothetical protein
MTAPIPRTERSKEFWGQWYGEYEQRPRPFGYKDGDEPVILGGIAKDILRDKDLTHMAERLRDLAALAQDAADPHLELDVFRLQLALHFPSK